MIELDEKLESELPQTIRLIRNFFRDKVKSQEELKDE